MLWTEEEGNSHDVAALVDRGQCEVTASTVYLEDVKFVILCSGHMCSLCYCTVYVKRCSLLNEALCVRRWQFVLICYEPAAKQYVW